ncbi:MAG: hypothetical protein RBS28_03735 [Rhodocyclaceae bacterium]|jgi:hypothetical protein|nr:hypothetical protein [Rhodocyclaceae bacterium]
MSRLRSMLGGMLFLLLTACAEAPHLPAQPDVMAGLLARFDRLAGASAEEQRRAHATARAAFTQDRSDLNRLNLALTLLLPHANRDDDRELLSLLDSAALSPIQPDDPAAEARRDLARLLHLLVSRQLRQAEDDGRRIGSLAHQLREERRRTAEMQQKIDRLLAIDREMRKGKRW